MGSTRWQWVFPSGPIALAAFSFGMSTALASPIFTMPASPSPQTVQVAMRGEYAQIDTKPIAATMLQLQQTSGSENDALIAQIEHEPENYAPPVLFVLAKVLFAKGNLDDAIFWFNAARLRGDFDASRCADPSARSAIPALVNSIPVALRRAQFDNLDKLTAIVDRVVQWDKSTPYNYEYRWINLHGLNALSSGLGDASANDKPLSLPQEQWPALAEKNRMDYLASLDTAIAQITKARAVK